MICIEIEGDVVGQVNGFVVIGVGLIIYGFLVCIIVIISVGCVGFIDIEGSVLFFGLIYMKGFYIFGGLLWYFLKFDYFLVFSVLFVFEQSYGGIDGDLVLGVEMCCLLSVLIGVLLLQLIVMMGVIDQYG